MDCNATCYFYDASVLPWKVVICDALALLDYNHIVEFKYEYKGDWDGIIEPCEEPGKSDAISIIENWFKFPF